MLEMTAFHGFSSDFLQKLCILKALASLFAWYIHFVVCESIATSKKSKTLFFDYLANSGFGEIIITSSFVVRFGQFLVQFVCKVVLVFAAYRHI